VDIQTGTLQDVASRYADGFFSRFILLDHMDWMPMRMILDEWSVFTAKARGDVRILWRSFAAQQHIAPLKYLDFHPENVAEALRLHPDRVAMYNSTHLATLPAGLAIVPRSSYAPPASVWDDATVLFHNFVHPIRGKDHQSRLESFYAGQAKSYDGFRHRFLHGRVPMIEAMPTPRKGVWVDLGGGTAANLEHLREHLRVFKKVVVLDLCRPLIEVARQRVAANGWGDVVELVVGDATDPAVPGMPKAGSVDVVTLSYSLTMIPDWQAALRNVRASAGGRTRMCCQ
jgi:protein-L-isoaspartate O-methyltransferase